MREPAEPLRRGRRRRSRRRQALGLGRQAAVARAAAAAAACEALASARSSWSRRSAGPTPCSPTPESRRPCRSNWGSTDLRSLRRRGRPRSAPWHAGNPRARCGRCDQGMRHRRRHVSRPAHCPAHRVESVLARPAPQPRRCARGPPPRRRRCPRLSRARQGRTWPCAFLHASPPLPLLLGGHSPCPGSETQVACKDRSPPC